MVGYAYHTRQVLAFHLVAQWRIRALTTHIAWVGLESPPAVMPVDLKLENFSQLLSVRYLGLDIITP